MQEKVATLQADHASMMRLVGTIKDVARLQQQSVGASKRNNVRALKTKMKPGGCCEDTAKFQAPRLCEILNKPPIRPSGDDDVDCDPAVCKVYSEKSKLGKYIEAVEGTMLEK